MFCWFLLLFTANTFAQKDPAWDNTGKSQWNDDFQKVEIPSSADGKIQKAYLYSSKSKTPKPLIVSLHTWSGDYTQKDPVTKEILARDWNYIHPDFRGINNTPESTGSSLVISDIEDAIQFGLKNTNANPNEVHLIGVSGGGFATLVAYMNIPYPVKSFSAWAPISDLEAWYWESVGRKQKYAQDIIHAVSKDSIFNSEEARKRSPLFQEFPKDLRKDARLYIYEGIHDGYTGSVPITQSINMYNRLVGEFIYGVSDLVEISKHTAGDSNLVSEQKIIELLTKRTTDNLPHQSTLFNRKIHLYRAFNSIEFILFEGGHEQLPQALGLLPQQNITPLTYNILTLGDSNAAHTDGWVEQLKKMMPQSFIYNVSRGGRTIGFDNNGQKDLNALASMNGYLDEAQQKSGRKKYDYIILCLGTNDTKKVFADRQDEVTIHFEKLLKTIQKHPLSKKSKPQFIFVTPPPIRTYNILDKYMGGNDRLEVLIPQLTAIAKKYDFTVVDVYHPLLGILDYYAVDGIHMAGAGQEIVASHIVESIQNK